MKMKVKCCRSACWMWMVWIEKMRAGGAAAVEAED